MIRKTKEGIWVIDGDTHYTKWVEDHGRLDVDGMTLPGVLALLKPGMSVIDVGAYIGDHTVAYSNAVGQDGCVVAYEPQTEAYKCLCINTELLSNVFCRCIGLCSDIMTVTSMKHESNRGASHMVERNNGDEPCILTTLDAEMKCDLFKRPVGLIKIDVEGMEPDVLDGASELIKADHPILVIEINKDALARYGCTSALIYDFLEEYGYKAITTIPETATVYSPQYDIICT